MESFVIPNLRRIFPSIWAKREDVKLMSEVFTCGVS